MNNVFSPKRIHKHYFLVRINREEQRKYRERLENGIIIDPTSAYMRFNLQQGELIAIGDEVARLLPTARVGDTLIFHHSIEGTAEWKGERSLQEANESNLIHQDEVDNYYMVFSDYAYGVVKTKYTRSVWVDDGFCANEFTSAEPCIDVMPHLVLAVPAEEEVDNREMVEKEVVMADGQKASILSFKNYKDSREMLLERIEELKEESIVKTDRDLRTRIMKEMEELSKDLNRLRLVKYKPVFVSEIYSRDCGETITPEHTLLYIQQGGRGVELQVTDVTFNGTKYSVLRTAQIPAVIRPL